MNNPIHSFLPWARRGLASQIQEVEIYDGVTQSTPIANVRATIGANVNIKVNNNQTPVEVLCL